MSYIPPNPNGSATSANSAPVVIASDQAALPLPTGAATSSAQSTGNTSLGTIATNTTGIATATNQTTMNSNLSTIVTNTGNGATEANQTNGNQIAQVKQSTPTNLNAVVYGYDSIGLGNPALSADSSGRLITKLSNGTNVADIVANDTSYNGQPINNATKTLTFTTSASGAQTLLANTDCRGYSYVEILYSSVGVGLALTGQFATAIGGTYINSNTFSQSVGSPMTSALGTTVSTLYKGPIAGNFFQLAVSALTSGIFTGTITLRAISPIPTTQNVNGSVTATVSGGIQLQTGTITTSSSAVTSAALNGNGAFAQVTIHGTYAGVSFGITCSDDGGTTFYNAPAWDTNNQRWIMPGSTITPGSNASNTYVVPIYGSTNELKVLASAYASGTANIRIGSSSGGIDPGSRMVQIMDSAGNARGANVDSSNNLMVNVGGGLIPTGTALNTYSNHITANATNTPTSSTAYISSIAISNEVGGTTSTITIQDKQGTPLKLINGIATTALTTAPTILTFNTPVKMVSGIDIITAGAVAATVDVWVNYYQ